MSVTNRIGTKVALIVGGAAGIGLAAARALAVDGFTVIIADRNGDAANGQAGVLNASGYRAIGQEVDAASLEQLEALFKFTADEFGTLNLLFSNAGLGGPGGFDFTEQDFDQVFNVNVKSHVFATKYALPLMQGASGGASIIYTSTGGALRFLGRSPLYAISKSAILMVTKAYARQLGPDGIRVNAICPGFVDTAFPRQWHNLTDAKFQAEIEKYRSAIPLQRVGEPDDIAGVVRFLASDASAYLTGAIIPVDGGFTA